MSYRQYSRMSVWLLITSTLVLFPVIAHADRCIFVKKTGCVICFSTCRDSIECYAYSCPDGSEGGDCSPCLMVKGQSCDRTKAIAQAKGSDRDENVLLAQRMARDYELARALKSLK